MSRHTYLEILGLKKKKCHGIVKKRRTYDVLYVTFPRSTGNGVGWEKKFKLGPLLHAHSSEAL